MLFWNVFRKWSGFRWIVAFSGSTFSLFPRNMLSGLGVNFLEITYIISFSERVRLGVAFMFFVSGEKFAQMCPCGMFRKEVRFLRYSLEIIGLTSFSKWKILGLAVNRMRSSEKLVRHWEMYMRKKVCRDVWHLHYSIVIGCINRWVLKSLNVWSR